MFRRASPQDRPRSRTQRRSQRSRARRIALVVGIVMALAAGGAASAFVLAGDPSTTGAERPATPAPSTTMALAATTTTTLPPLVTPPPSPSGIIHPVEARLPAVPAVGLGPGAKGPLVTAYQQRLKDLRFDPGAIDGLYGQQVAYSVQALQKLKGLPVNGVIGPAEVTALSHFTYNEPLQPDGEPARTEVDVTKQVLTLYENGQPKLITTISTGSGERYCYDNPKDEPTERLCTVSNTPSGRYQYYLHRTGWDVGVLGGLYNPFYFNGGIAVHGYEQVPARPASHGCVRIPMHIAEYFPTLVQRGDVVYVFGGTPFGAVTSEPLPAARA